ncbi:hypothetical protein MXB_1228 [Myxobolus squamalis]|nr:hypothetical protein MXB_1228 [Myxobolus squamalis]
MTFFENKKHEMKIKYHCANCKCTANRLLGKYPNLKSSIIKKIQKRSEIELEISNAYKILENTLGEVAEF